ncbi:IS256 family transposase, partial [Gordonia paraffinivorans]|uniref:transposase n=1 Tax=Gordonia paraffinivorans TaxID=175628 RepID=UPI001C92E324
MTQDHSALLAQLDALRSADAGAVFAELIRASLQALIEAEATEMIGAGRYPRSEGRRTPRHGHRPQTVSTPARAVAVPLPHLRSGSFFPSL